LPPHLPHDRRLGREGYSDEVGALADRKGATIGETGCLRRGEGDGAKGGGEVKGRDPARQLESGKQQAGGDVVGGQDVEQPFAGELLRGVGEAPVGGRDTGTAREGGKVTTVPANLAVFRVGGDGTLTFVRRYEVAVDRKPLWWMGLVALP